VYVIYVWLIGDKKHQRDWWACSCNAEIAGGLHTLWEALWFPAMASGLPGARHGIFSACETERRPRGASRASSLLHLFRASFACANARDRLVGTTRYRAMRQSVRAQIPQEWLARNKCRSELARDAPRGRRSISSALQIARQEPSGLHAICRS